MNKETLLRELNMSEDCFKRMLWSSVEEFFDTNKNANLERMCALGFKQLLK